MDNTKPGLPGLELYGRLEYFQDLIQRIEQTQTDDSVTLMTMSYDPRVPVIAQLTISLQQAAQRGVRVRLLVDAMSYMRAYNAPFGPMFYGSQPSANSPSVYGQIYRQLDDLRQFGAQVSIINQPSHAFGNLYANRSHIKLGLINNRIYIPSCNLDDEKQFDLVVGWDDAATASWLSGLVDDITKVGNVRQALNLQDQTRVIKDKMTLFIDSGVKHQSIILQKALKLIDQETKSLYITSQYFPGGSTGQHLKKAKNRNVDVKIWYGHPASHGKQVIAQYLYNWRERLRLPAEFFTHRMPATAPKLHAKLLAGSQTTLTGSHNYADLGVRFGTAEIALLVDDTSFAQATIDKITEQLESARIT